MTVLSNKISGGDSLYLTAFYKKNLVYTPEQEVQIKLGLKTSRDLTTDLTEENKAVLQKWCLKDLVR